MATFIDQGDSVALHLRGGLRRRQRAAGRGHQRPHLHGADLRLLRGRTAHHTVYVTDKDGLTGWAEYQQQPFAFDGFYFPIKTPPVVKAPAGSTIPVPFTWATTSGMSMLHARSPRRARCGSLSSVPRSGMLTYAVWNGHTPYLWQTKAPWSGSCRRLVFNFVGRLHAHRLCAVQSLILDGSKRLERPAPRAGPLRVPARRSTVPPRLPRPGGGRIALSTGLAAAAAPVSEIGAARGPGRG